MPSPEFPRASSELFPGSLELSPKQRAVLDALRKYPEGARSRDLAEDLGMHVNTVRGHLDELIARGAVHHVTAPAEGRGRPSLLFRTRTPDREELTHKGAALLDVLASMVIDNISDPEEQQRQAALIGRTWARRTGEARADTGEEVTLAEVVELLHTRMRELGFDPDHPQDTKDGSCEIALRACPFVAGPNRPSKHLCAIHRGLMLEMAGIAEDSPLVLTLRPLSGEGTCTVELTDRS